MLVAELSNGCKEYHVYGCLLNGSSLTHVHLMIVCLKGNFVEIQKDIDNFVLIQKEVSILITVKLSSSG